MKAKKRRSQSTAPFSLSYPKLDVNNVGNGYDRSAVPPADNWKFPANSHRTTFLPTLFARGRCILLLYYLRFLFLRSDRRFSRHRRCFSSRAAFFSASIFKSSLCDKKQYKDTREQRMPITRNITETSEVLPQMITPILTIRDGTAKSRKNHCPVCASTWMPPMPPTLR